MTILINKRQRTFLNNLITFMERGIELTDKDRADIIEEAKAILAGINDKPGPSANTIYDITIEGQGTWTVLGAKAAHEEVVKAIEANILNGRPMMLASFYNRITGGYGQWHKRIMNAEGEDVVISVIRRGKAGHIATRDARSPRHKG